MFKKIQERLQSEARSYAKEAIEKPVKRDSFEYGTHHGYLKALSHVELWIKELLEEEEDENE